MDRSKEFDFGFTHCLKLFSFIFSPELLIMVKIKNEG